MFDVRLPGGEPNLIRKKDNIFLSSNASLLLLFFCSQPLRGRPWQGLLLLGDRST